MCTKFCSKRITFDKVIVKNKKNTDGRKFVDASTAAVSFHFKKYMTESIFATWLFWEVCFRLFVSNHNKILFVFSLKSYLTCLLQLHLVALISITVRERLFVCVCVCATEVKAEVKSTELGDIALKTEKNGYPKL